MPSFLSVPVPVTLVLIKCGIQNRAVRGDSPVLQGITVVYMQHLFHFPILLPVESEYQATEDAEKYRRRYQKAGDFIEDPEESPETDDGDCRPYRRNSS